MNDTKSNASQASRKLFSLVLLAYLTLSLAGFAFVWRVFGLAAANCLSLIQVLPLIAGIRMRRRWQSLRQREFAYLVTLLVVAVGAVVGLVWAWYAAGLDRQHSSDMELAEFNRLLHKDPAFRDVELEVSPRRWVFSGAQMLSIRGTVASQADLDRLKSLAAQYHIQWRDEVDKVEVNNGTRQSDKVSGQSSSNEK
jgi:hypothetical protein